MFSTLIRFLWSQLTLTQTENLKTGFQQKIETLIADDRVWMDITMFFAIAQK
ncbi:MAG: hypothetical protein AAFO04_25690 [Cyanobacteria bacterium J06592_8]